MSMLIGITGKRGSGKSTAAKSLKRLGFFEVSFAEPLKEATKIIFGLTDEEVYGDYKIKETVIPELGVSPRKILQKFGTEVMREFIHVALPELKITKGEIWVEAFKKLYLNTWVQGNYVVSDVRYLNEAKAIRELGGIILRIERPALKLEKSDHASEMEMDKIIPDHVIVGKEGVVKLQEQVKKWYLSLQHVHGG